MNIFRPTAAGVIVVCAVHGQMCSVGGKARCPIARGLAVWYDIHARRLAFRAATNCQSPLCLPLWTGWNLAKRWEGAGHRI